MTLLLSCQNLSKAYSTRILFKDLSLSIFSGEQIGLIGPNGTGKSTLLKILAGEDRADEGEVSMRKLLKIGYVPQTSYFPDLPIREILFAELKKEKELADYEKELLVETWLSKSGFEDKSALASMLSGGWKKRLSLAQALITSPELLLLDEPTNHLDLEGILWLEKFLVKEAPTYLLVSHDRTFLQNAANRIIELDHAYPKGVFAIDGPYMHFLEKKEEFLLGQLERERSLASKARRESEWLSQSPKARTSKSKSRVEDAHELLDDLSDVKSRNRQKKAEINFAATERETRKLLVAKNIAKKISERLLFSRLDLTLSPGTRIGLMGPNGSGKTTLLKLLAEEETPDQGTIKRADGLKTVYFDQHRTQLPDAMTLREALSPQGDYVRFRGQSIHVNGWCKRFLFSPDLLDMPLGKLSGGERARISIAHLMLQPADLLLLDEPTNDLDIRTLETLEESLQEFPGAVVLITHDRCMLERICNLFLALGDPSCSQLFVEYRQWESAANEKAPGKDKEKKSVPLPRAKLSYREKKEYEEIEGQIAALEESICTLNHRLEKSGSNEEPERLKEICTEIALKETQIEELYLRFLELDKKKNGSSV